MSADVAAGIERARQAERSGRPGRARWHYERALRAVRCEEDGKQAASLIRWVGASYRAEGHHAAARDCFRASLAVARLRREPQDVAHALNWLGIVNQDRGRIDRADRLFVAARRIARRIGDRRIAAMADQNLGINRNIRGELDGALFHYRRSLRCYEALGETRFMAGVLNVLGMLHTDLEEWCEAESAFDRAAAICAAQGDLHTHTMVEVNRVELYVARGQLEKAESACQRAYRLGTRLDQPTVLGEIFRWRGVLEREAGRFEEAERYLGGAEGIARKHEAPLLEAEANRELGLLHWRQRRNREALAALLRSRTIFSGIRAQRDLAEVARRLAELEEAFLGIVREWAESIEEKDEYTNGHCHRVATFATALARRLDFDEATLKWFEMGAYLHDVGKIEVPLEILNKPGKLDAAEWEIMKSHTVAGDAIVAGLGFPWDVGPIVRNHHERWDGGGYPDGLAGEGIPLPARVLTVADVYDALTTDRPYRAAFPTEKALGVMEEMSGRELDPALFAAFRGLVRSGAFRTLLAA
jgi:putative nucleotidyltransferase with HDIG domain